MSKDKDDKAYYLGNKNLPRSGTEHEYSAEMIREIQKAQKNILYFAENFFYIVNLDRGREKIKLHACQKKVLKSLKDNRFVCLLASRQIGKALALDTPIPTPTGYTTMGALKDGDRVYGSDGNPCNVIKAHDIMYDRPCYKITFSDGESVIADENHRWLVQTHYDRCHNRSGSVKLTKELLHKQTVNVKNPQLNYSIPRSAALQYPKKLLEIDPYLLGYWLGDGVSRYAGLSVSKYDVDEAKHNLQIPCELLREERTSDGHYMLWINQKPYHKNKQLTTILKDLNVIQNKHIPRKYLESSYDQRLNLLKGLMDTDGSITGRKCVFYNTNENLANDVLELVRSLGFKATKKVFLNNKNPAGTKIGKPMFRITFSANVPVFKLQRKIDKQCTDVSIKQSNHYIQSVERVDSVPVRCITVDAEDEQFVIGHTCICSKNTTLMTIYALWIACFQKDQRILIVANKEQTAINILKRVRLAYEMLPNHIKPGVEEWGKTGVALENGSSIGISTTSSSAGRGDSCNCLILDELAFIENHLITPFWRSVYPIISSSQKSKIFIASTPNGTDNLFYDLYTNASAGINNWHAERVDWWEIPGRDDQWKLDQIKTLGSHDAFAQEFGNCVAGNSTLEIINNSNEQKCITIQELYDSL